MNILLKLALIGAVFYFGNKRDHRADVIDKILKFIPDAERVKFRLILDRMTEQELKDTLKYLEDWKSGKKIRDPAFEERMRAISNKYNIFT